MEKGNPPPYNANPYPYPNPPYQAYPQPMPNSQHMPMPTSHHMPMPESQPVHINVQQPPVTHTVVMTPTVMLTGNCPGCRRGVLRTNFTCCGICLAIFFFPIGILCCLLMTEKQCSHCGGVF